MEKKYILVIRPLKDRELLLKSIIRKGYGLIVLDEPNGDLLGFADHQILVESIKDFKEVYFAAVEFNKKLPISGIIACLDYLLPVVGSINESLSLKGHSFKSASICASKQMQREILKNNLQEATPRFTTIPTHADSKYISDVISKSFTYPVILKPSDSSASRGVVRIDKADEIPKALDYACKAKMKQDLMLEEFIEGREVSFETFTFNGVTELIAITEKRISGENKFLEHGRSIPATLKDDEIQHVIKIINDFVKLVNVDNIVLHTEIKIDGNKVKVVEVNGRIAGGSIPDMLLSATGVNIYDVAIDLLIGIHPDIEIKENKYSSLEAFTFKESMRLNNIKIDNPNDGTFDDTIVRVHAHKGDLIMKTENDNDVIGFVIATANSLADSIKKANRLKQLITLE